MTALLALMLLHDSRRAARVDERGELVTLEEQDRSRWDRAQIAEGAGAGRRRAPARRRRLLRAAGGDRRPPRARRRAPEDTDWPQIAALYGLLLRLHPSPVVALNHAAAVAMGRAARIAGCAWSRSSRRAATLDGYHLLPAAKADILRRLGRPAEAAEAYERALRPRHPGRGAAVPRAAAARGARGPRLVHCNVEIGSVIWHHAACLPSQRWSSRDRFVKRWSCAFASRSSRADDARKARLILMLADGERSTRSWRDWVAAPPTCHRDTEST